MQENKFFPRSSRKECSLVNTLILVTNSEGFVRPILDFWPPNCKIINSCWFKPLSLWQFGSSTRKLIQFPFCFSSQKQTNKKSISMKGSRLFLCISLRAFHLAVVFPFFSTYFCSLYRLLRSHLVKQYKQTWMINLITNINYLFLVCTSTYY